MPARTPPTHKSTGQHWLNGLTLGWLTFTAVVDLALAATQQSVALLAAGLDASLTVGLCLTVIAALDFDNRAWATRARHSTRTAAAVTSLLLTALLASAIITTHRPNLTPLTLGWCVYAAAGAIIFAAGANAVNRGRNQATSVRTAAALPSHAAAAFTTAGALLLASAQDWWWTDPTAALAVALLAAARAVYLRERTANVAG